MGKSKGYIKLYRNILDWELFSDVNARLVFIQFLLTVNYEDKIWQGYLIKRGSRVISYEKFAKEVGLTKRQVRGTIEKLEKARCVARLRFPRFSIISVNNFEKYQEGARSAAPKRHEVGTKSGTETATTIIKKKRRKEAIPPELSPKPIVLRALPPPLPPLRAARTASRSRS